MNKTQLVDALAERLGDRRTAATAVDGLLATIVETVQGGGSVSITGFGVFEGRARAARTGRNPRTGEAIAVPAATVPAFRPGAGFRNAVAGTASAPTPRSAPARRSTTAAAPTPAQRAARSSQTFAAEQPAAKAAPAKGAAKAAAKTAPATASPKSAAKAAAKAAKPAKSAAAKPAAAKGAKAKKAKAKD